MKKTGAITIEVKKQRYIYMYIEMQNKVTKYTDFSTISERQNMEV